MAQNIWDDACKNALQKPDRIDRYLKDDPDCINRVGGQNSLTPLAGACYHGHLEVVTLLLAKGARPNAPCPQGRTALFFALKQAPKDQLPIVKALLSAGADPNEVYPEDNANALTIAIEESQDKDLVHALIDAGANPTEENKKEARAKKMEASLRPWSPWTQLVIYCDDGGSREIPSQSNQKQRELVSRITNIATKLLLDDAVVKVRFINNPFDRDVTISEVDGVIASGFYGGSTLLGTQLVKKIIQPLVYDNISNPGYLLICTITNGTPDGGDTPFRRVVSDCRKALVSNQHDPTSVMFCISQIGTDLRAKPFLDSLRNDGTIKDVVYCTTDQLDADFVELRANEMGLEAWLLNMLTKPIMRKGRV